MSNPVYSIGELRKRLSSGETSAHSLVESAVNAAEELNPSLNAFLEIDRKGAQKRADEIDQTKASSTLAGIPVAVKDNLCVRGLQTSCGSKILGDYQAPYDATVIERLLQA